MRSESLLYTNIREFQLIFQLGYRFTTLIDEITINYYVDKLYLAGNFNLPDISANLR